LLRKKDGRVAIGFVITRDTLRQGRSVKRGVGRLEELIELNGQLRRLNQYQ